MKIKFQKKLISDNFFDLENSKKVTLDRDKIIVEISKILGVNVKNITPLKYWENDTKKYLKTERVYSIIYNNHFLKIRYCKNHMEAKSLYARSKFAYQNKIPSCKPINIIKNYVVFEYFKGENLVTTNNKKVIKKISEIQYKMNKISIDPIISGTLRFKIKKNTKKWILFLKSKGLIDKSQGSILLRSIEHLPKIIPCFDHQDFGVHNLISDGKSIKIIDEEAFGILPLGYGIVRPVFDRNNYRVVKNKSLNDYLLTYNAKERNYIKDSAVFWKNLFIIRNSVRRYYIGNTQGAKKLLRELNYEK